PLSTLNTPCPKCGGVVHENYKKFQCEQCDFSLWKIIASRRMENEEIEQLIRERAIGPVQGFRSRMGRPFAAMVRLKDDFTTELDFDQSSQDEGNAEPVDFSGKQALGKCPKCGSNVYDHELAYVGEKAVGPGRSFDILTGKIILQRNIEPDQVVKLSESGNTALLHRFISTKARPSTALLSSQPDGKLGVDFAPRHPKKGATTAAKTTSDGPAKTPARPATKK